MFIDYKNFIQHLNYSIEVFGTKGLIPVKPDSLFTSRRLTKINLKGGADINHDLLNKCLEQFKEKKEVIREYVIKNKVNPKKYKKKIFNKYLDTLIGNDECKEFKSGIRGIFNEVWKEIKEDERVSEGYREYNELIVNIFRDLLEDQDIYKVNTDELTPEMISDIYTNLESRFNVIISKQYIKDLLTEYCELIREEETNLIRYDDSIKVINVKSLELIHKYFNLYLGLLKGKLVYDHLDFGTNVYYIQLKIIFLVKIQLKNYSITLKIQNSIFINKWMRRIVVLLKDHLISNKYEPNTYLTDFKTTFKTKHAQLGKTTEIRNLEFLDEKDVLSDELDEIIDMIKLIQSDKAKIKEYIYNTLDEDNKTGSIFNNNRAFCDAMYETYEDEEVEEELEEVEKEEAEADEEEVEVEEEEADEEEVEVQEAEEEEKARLKQACYDNKYQINVERRCNTLLSVILDRAYDYFSFSMPEEVVVSMSDLNDNYELCCNSVCCAISAIFVYINLKINNGHELSDRDKTLLIVLYLTLANYDKLIPDNIPALQLLDSFPYEFNFKGSDEYEDSYTYCYKKGMSPLVCKKLLKCYKGILYLYMADMTTDKIDGDTIFTENNHFGEDEIIFDYTELIANNNIGVVLTDVAAFTNIMILQSDLSYVEVPPNEYDFRNGIIIVHISDITAEFESMTRIEKDSNKLLVTLTKVGDVKLIDEKLYNTGIFKHSYHYTYSSM
jgi:hypothetical protein